MDVSSGRGARRPRVQRARRLRARRRLAGLRIALRAAGQAGRSRPRLDARARRSICWSRRFLVLASRHDPSRSTAFVVLTVATVAIAWRTEAATGAVPVAAILAAVVMAALGGAR